MLNGILELEVWRIIGQGNDKIGRGYSRGGRGWVPQPHCPAKRQGQIRACSPYSIKSRSRECRQCQCSIAALLECGPRWRESNSGMGATKRSRTQMEGQAEFECEHKVRRLDDLEKEAPWVSRLKGSDRVSQLDLFKCGPVNAVART
ncbi:hypothetical protein GOBAR_AA36257 [Gossypium barbadense]|uniref:Uncharacterized protein n=1 Tax=Gossypium barbadense TaxID=3634 RepID=A0A2P5W044_GOSBA|nr:hypothetical protein GOBAR_AA36257 [Gossypium barbadense]